ncbi:MAG: V-type ATP synthase subunit E [Firmicutes bacterium]|jgi:V/A-type H+-transporting ATPase subunit E|nr:V-type ATP synthase subunit E [Bacillota bacterium]MDH7495965.1 V-type ATP synthase subunit E [Bacillota bacterium]
MSALEKMQEKILQDAKAKADEIVAAATAEAQAIVAEAREEATRKRDEVLARGKENADEEMRRALTLAELDARKQLLATKAALIDEVFQEARKRLTSLEPGRYRAYLKRAILEAVESGEEEVVLSARDLESVGPEVVSEVNAELAKQGRKGALRLSGVPGGFTGGFVLRTGRTEVNSTFDALLAREREALVVEVAKVLFG